MHKQKKAADRESQLLYKFYIAPSPANTTLMVIQMIFKSVSMLRSRIYCIHLLLRRQLHG